MTDPCCDLGDLLSPKLFKALGDANRVAILAQLANAGCECTVSKLAECCPVDMSVVSRHLATLRDAGVVAAERRGREVWYSINGRELAGTLRRLADVLESCCPPEGGGCGPGSCG